MIRIHLKKRGGRERERERERVGMHINFENEDLELNSFGSFFFQIIPNMMFEFMFRTLEK